MAANTRNSLMERNDELLLKLGWTTRPYHIHNELIGPEWLNPSGVSIEIHGDGSIRLRPRPYDSVDDGIAICKERDWGWRLETLRHSDDSVSYLASVCIGTSETDTPAEALAEAILKAVNHA